MTNTPTQRSPLERAHAAAEQLAAEGQPVTSRAVRSRAGVMTTIAAQAAKAWNDAQALTRTPEIPPAVTTRLEAIWAAAYHAAHGQFDADRDGWAARIERAEAEAHQLAQDSEQAQAELTETQASQRQTSQLLADTTSQLDQARTEAATARADTAEKALTEVLATIGKPTHAHKPRTTTK